MFITPSPQREPPVMNQFQALFESFPTLGGVPVLTLCNEGRFPYLQVIKKKWIAWGDGEWCTAWVNLICHKRKRKEERNDEVARGSRGKMREVSDIVRAPQIETLSENCTHQYVLMPLSFLLSWYQGFDCLHQACELIPPCFSFPRPDSRFV